MSTQNGKGVSKVVWSGWWSSNGRRTLSSDIIKEIGRKVAKQVIQMMSIEYAERDSKPVVVIARELNNLGQERMIQEKRPGDK